MLYRMTIRGALPAPLHKNPEIKELQTKLDALATERDAVLKTMSRTTIDTASQQWEKYLSLLKESVAVEDRLNVIAHPHQRNYTDNTVSQIVNTMHELEMVHVSVADGPFADYDVVMHDMYGETVRQEDLSDDDHVHIKREAARRDRPIQISHGSSDVPTIPMHKLTTTYGWIITSDEIRESLAVWDNLNNETQHDVTFAQSDVFTEWIDFLRTAQQNLGLTIH